MWQGIAGHDRIVDRFRQTLVRGRLASTYLFAGPPGVGKHTFAMRLAQSLLCETRPAEALDPCERCPGCIQALAGTHPDLHLVSKAPDRSFIPLSAFLGDDAHRMREGLCHWISLRPSRGRRKIAIVDDADLLNEEGANCLLKTLEEPPPLSVLILIATSAERQLPTIRSRCQIVRFAPLANETVAELLLAQGIAADAQQAHLLAEHSHGSLTWAAQLADEELWNFRTQLLGRLASRPLDGVKTAPWVSAFIDEAGKEANTRRQRTRLVMTFAAEFYRALMRSMCGAPVSVDAELAAAVTRAASDHGRTIESIAHAIDRCLDGIEQVDSNANQATLVDCWIDDLAQIDRGAHLATVR